MAAHPTYEIKTQRVGDQRKWHQNSKLVYSIVNKLTGLTAESKIGSGNWVVHNYDYNREGLAKAKAALATLS